MKRKRCPDCGFETCTCLVEDVIDVAVVTGLLDGVIDAVGDVLTSMLDAITDDD